MTALTSPAVLQRRLTARHRRRIQPPYAAGLLALQHRLSADLRARNLARIHQVHQASVR